MLDIHGVFINIIVTITTIVITMYHLASLSWLPVG